jgi:hypothetical protein
MVKAKITPDKIIEKIKSSRCNFDVNPSVIDELRYRGVPSSVLQAMLDATYNSSSPRKRDSSQDAANTQNQKQQSTVLPERQSPAQSSSLRSTSVENTSQQQPKALSVGIPSRANESATMSTTIPKRIRWSKPLCKQIDQQGRELGTIDPTIAKCDELYVQGQLIRSIEGNQIYVSSAAGYNESHYVSDLFVANIGLNRIDVLPEKAVLVSWPKLNEPPVTFGPIAPEKIASKIKSRAKWKIFFNSLSGALATQTANVNTTTEGSITAIGPGGIANGVYSESSMSTITMPDREAQRRAYENNQRIRSEAEAKGDIFLARALLSTTLFKGQDVRGALYFEKKNFQVGILALDVAGTSFEFAIAPPIK